MLMLAMLMRAWRRGRLLPSRRLLLRELLLALVVLECLLLQLLDILLERQAGFLGVVFELTALHGLELLRRHAALLGFCSHGLLHGSDLGRGGLLRGWARGC